jgi:transcription termination factor Rho
MNLSELKQKPIGELLDIAKELGLENLARTRKQDVIFSILKRAAKNGSDIYGDGVLEILQDGFGFLRSPRKALIWPAPMTFTCRPARYVASTCAQATPSPARSGPPKEGERYFAMLKVSDDQHRPAPSNAKTKVLFENLTPLFPNERLMVMEVGQRLHRGHHRPHDRFVRTDR